MVDDQRATREAARWLAKHRAPGFRDWQPMVAWLRASDANADAYVKLLGQEIAVASRPASRQPSRPNRGFLIAAIGIIIFIGATFLIAHQLSRRSDVHLSDCR